MSTNVCSRSRRNFVEPKAIAEQYNISVKQVYKLLTLPVFAEAKKKMGTRCTRVDQDKFYEISEQYFGRS